MDLLTQGGFVDADVSVLLRVARHRQNPLPVRLGHRLVEARTSLSSRHPAASCKTCPLRRPGNSRSPGGTWARPRRPHRLDSFDILQADALGYVPQGAGGTEVLFPLIAHRCPALRPQVPGHYIQLGRLSQGKPALFSARGTSCTLFHFRKDMARFETFFYVTFHRAN